MLAAAGGVATAASAPAKVHVGISASFVRSGGGALWVTDRTDNRVIRVDPVAGRVVWRVAVADRPFGLAYGAGSVWVGSRDGSRVTRVKASTKRRQARIGVGASPYALAFGGGSVWVSNEGSGTVSRLGPKRNKVVKPILVGGQPNGIAVAFRKVWVADYSRGRLIRIDPVSMFCSKHASDRRGFHHPEHETRHRYRQQRIDITAMNRRQPRHR